MIIYLSMKYESNISMFSKDIARKPFFLRRSRTITLIIISGSLSIIQLDLYLMIIYLCMKYESNIPMYSKDIARNLTIFHTEIKGHNPHNNWWILSVIKLDLYFMIIYMCMKYESNTPKFSKDTALKPFFVHTDVTYV